MQSFAGLPIGLCNLQIVADNAGGHESPQRFDFLQSNGLGSGSKHSADNTHSRWESCIVTKKEQPKCPQRRGTMRRGECDRPMRLPCRTSSIDLEDLKLPQLVLWSRANSSRTPPGRAPRFYRSPPRLQPKQVFSKSA